MAIMPLCNDEKTSLRQYERSIEKGMQTFLEVGKALKAIRDEKLFRESHTSFRDYVKERWGWSKSHAYRYIEAAEHFDGGEEKVSPIGDTSCLDNPEPQNEHQARQIIKKNRETPTESDDAYELEHPPVRPVKDLGSSYEPLHAEFATCEHKVDALKSLVTTVPTPLREVFYRHAANVLILKACLEEGQTITQIANELGIHREVLYKLAQDEGLDYPEKRLSKEQVESVVSAVVDDDLSFRQAAEKLGISSTSVYRYVRRERELNKKFAGSTEFDETVDPWKCPKHGWVNTKPCVACVAEQARENG